MRNLREGVDMITVRAILESLKDATDINDLVHGYLHVSLQLSGMRGY